MMVSKLNSLCACACLHAHTHPRGVRACVRLCTTLGERKTEEIVLVPSESVFSAYAIHYCQNNKPHRLNRLSQNFWPAYCICVENKDWSGNNYKEDYHISSVK